MRTFVCIILVFALVSGCESQPQAPGETTEPKFDSPGGPVSVLALDRNEQEKRIEAMMLVGDCVRHLAIGPLEDSSLPMGFSAELTDAGRSLLFRLELAWDPEQPDLISLVEQTESDMLTIIVRRDGDRAIEEYRANGESFAIDYPREESDLKQRAIAHCLADEPDQTVTSEVAALAVKVAGFEEFYEHQVGTTLDANQDGEVLVSLVNDESFVDYVLGETGDAGKAKKGSKAAMRICALATVCAFFKCTFGGGWLNPICVSCTGTGLACAIATIGCWIADCET